MNMRFGALAWAVASALLVTQSPAPASEWTYPAKPEDHVEQLDNKRFAAETVLLSRFEEKNALLFKNGDPKALEAAARDADRPLAALPNGASTIIVFYRGVDQTVRTLKPEDKAEWDKAFGIADRWLAAYPGSPYAGLYRTRLLRERAWKIRGHDYSSKTSPEAMAEFEQIILQVKQDLESQKSMSGSVAEWYEQMADTYTESSASLEEMRALADEALTKFPAAFEIYNSVSRAFLPKWGGSDKDFAAFARHVNETAPSGYGPVLYARIYYNASCCDYFDGQVFAKGGADWSTLKQGLEEIRRRYPDSFNDDREAYFACSAMDVSVLPELMKKIGNSPDPGIWKYPKFFRSCQKIAESMRQHPDGRASAWYPE